MNRIEFMNRLEQLLWSLPAEERSDALKYYNDYFDDAGPEREQEVIRELISPEHVAKTILEGMNQGKNSGWNDNQYQNEKYWNEQRTDGGYSYDTSKAPQGMKFKMPVWGWILILVTLPVTLPVILGIFSTIIGLFFAVFGVVIGFFTGGIGLFFGAVALFGTGFSGLGCFCLGLGCLMECIVFLIVPFAIWLFRGAIPGIYRFIKKQVNKLIDRGGNMA